MSSRTLALNSKVGIIVAILGAIGFVWTYFMELRPMELFVPRIALGLIAVGGALVLVKDLLKPEKIPKLEVKGVLPYAIVICIILWLYGWAFRNIGLMTSTFAFLSLWWVYINYRDCKRGGSFQNFVPRILKMLALAAIVAFIVNFLFINLLSMHLPATPLP